ncbi:hypothetical protein [Aquisalinus flavus]|uniref:hypothetical protein n=1 Tax=Aquisalinus flavus TaxID=1526572 RepID=UPI00165F8746|nr:hypothetical protein [Aquisalinus flavus]MBD0425763.1 hypothetical protein [Aquisalinus flavus]UNE48629.1 hypothetical protein FF099_11510 [Aquisalinus flavus]
MFTLPNLFSAQSPDIAVGQELSAISREAFPVPSVFPTFFMLTATGDRVFLLWRRGTPTLLQFHIPLIDISNLSIKRILTGAAPKPPDIASNAPKAGIFMVVGAKKTQWTACDDSANASGVW